ncbi:glycogen synthase GlgA [Peribacillus psychrosaccharolyticus]|uniref:Glycogen synthase n=1 Tax=Peribacillus psychrosaccharolyticus TaxID=1407 RepID=A0A974S111_PERPY|nr:glycogen synthase GlgA [Peribacillus psychrosaccharolyticus]MEC2057352.1 glycogen synthase GlgA [Peribacillus psychrosaccharolyticus]MED3742822.1 glycogen synthase GlgA [Peribacillus psychrosaccharolyticus]QQT01104.1 glycogen synthase GlgA [Peribacillus psychrosaccharolyticus]
MNILFAASECAPFVKTGGLGDVIGALPLSLTEEGANVSVVLPKYGDLSQHYKDQMEWIKSIEVPVGWRSKFCGIEKYDYQGITVYFLDNEYYFKRHGSYGFGDDGERFAFFSRAVLEALPYFENQPDLIHCHDWQTGLIPVLLKAHYEKHPFYENIKTVFTIHNLRYQGVYSKSVLSDLLDLSELYYHMDGLEFYGNVSYLKAGLAYADCLTTVSKTYAAEIQTPYYGENLDGFLRKRGTELSGIVNGIDDFSYNPERDEQIFMPYTDSEGKMANKKHLQEILGLPVRDDVPIISIVTRLVDQKGIDLILHIFHEMMGQNVQFVVLGTGEQRYEDSFRYFMDVYPEKVSAQLYFDETMARKIYAGSDMFLMPSAFEPCGIGQLLAFRYGTLPIVRETGGLKDTVIPYNRFTGEGNGFSFANYNAHELLYTIEQAVALYRFEPKKWKDLVARVMALDFSWTASSQQYLTLYKDLMDGI